MIRHIEIDDVVVELLRFVQETTAQVEHLHVVRSVTTPKEFAGLRHGVTDTGLETFGGVADSDDAIRDVWNENSRILAPFY